MLFLILGTQDATFNKKKIAALWCFILVGRQIIKTEITLGSKCSCMCCLHLLTCLLTTLDQKSFSALHCIVFHKPV